MEENLPSLKTWYCLQQAKSLSGYKSQHNLGVRVFAVSYLPCNSSTKFMFALRLSQVSAVFLKPGEITSILVMVKWVWDRKAAQGGVGTRGPSQLAGEGLRASLTARISLNLQLSRKEGLGSKPRKSLSPQTKQVQFQELVFCILLLHSALGPPR